MSPLNRSGLWARITCLLQSEDPLTTRQIADRLDAEVDNVRRLLMIYAQRGRTNRVIYRDRPRVHWRLVERDPRRDPRPGDVIRRGHATRRVERIRLTPCGALNTVHGQGTESWSATDWRAWARVGARVLTRGAS